MIWYNPFLQHHESNLASMPEPTAVSRRQSPGSPQPWMFSFGLLMASLVLNEAAALLLRFHTTVATVDADESEYWNIASELRAHGLSGIPARRTLPL